MRKAIIASFHLLLFLIPFLWTPPTFELFEYPKMMFVYAATAVIGGLWISRMIVEERVLIKKTFLDIPLLLFFFSQLASTLFSIDVHTSLFGYYSRFHGGLFSTISYVILYYAFVSNATKEDVKNIVRTLIISAVFASLYAFPEHFGHSPSCYIITGSFDASCWVQDVQTRVFGTFGQPNWLAAYLITIIFIPLAGIISKIQNASLPLPEKSHHTKHATNTPPPTNQVYLPSILFKTLAGITFFTVLLFTKSRSGLAGFALGLAIFSLLNFFVSSTKVKLSKILITSYLLLFALFMSFGYGVFAQADRLTAPIRDSYNQLFTNKESATRNPQPAAPSGTQLEVGGTESGVIRQIVWKGALALFRKYPLFGSGVETFAYSYYNVRPAEHNLVSEWDFLYNKAHNEFLNFLATTGAFGLGSYLAMMIVYCIWTIKTLFGHQEPEARNTRIAFLAGYLALAVSNFFGFSTVPVALLFFLFPAMAHILAKEEDEEVSKTTPLQPSHFLILTLIWILPLLILVRLGRMVSADIKFNHGKQALEAGNLAEAYNSLKLAVEIIQNEPQYTDQFSLAAARGAVSLDKSGQATGAAQLAQQALLLSNKTIELNRVHLNYYKSRARLFIDLSTISPQSISYAEQTLKKAIQLSPTDAKLYYNLGLLTSQLGREDEALQLFETAVSLKTNYEGARLDLAEIYEKQSKIEQAKEQYRYILENINPNNAKAQTKLSQ